MIHITRDEFLQLEEFLIDRNWQPGTQPNAWVKTRFVGPDVGDIPHFLVVAEERSDTIYEVAGMGLEGEWSDQETLTYLTDVLRAGTDYGIRVNIENYLQKIGVTGYQGHALNLVKIGYGEIEIPPPPEPLVRNVFFEDAQGWVQFKWRGGPNVHVTIAVKVPEVDGYGTYYGYLHTSHGNGLQAPAQDGFPYGLFIDRRTRERGIPSDRVTEAHSQRGSDPGAGDVSSPGGSGGDSPEPIPHPCVPELSEEVLLEVRGEPGHGPTGDEPGGGVSNS